MKRTRLAAITGILVAFGAIGASALDIPADKIRIRDNADDPGKRELQIQSTVSLVTYASADNPRDNGASIHLWNATNDFCYIATAGADRWKDSGKSWTYRNREAKNQLRIRDTLLKLKLRSGVGIDLTDTPQGTIHASIQLGPTGTRYCMICSGPEVSTDKTLKFEASWCNAASCDPEPAGCLPSATTTTTSMTTTTTGG